jgi:hypothetical protein
MTKLNKLFTFNVDKQGKNAMDHLFENLYNALLQVNDLSYCL